MLLLPKNGYDGRSIFMADRDQPNASSVSTFEGFGDSPTTDFYSKLNMTMIR